MRLIGPPSRDVGKLYYLRPGGVLEIGISDYIQLLLSRIACLEEYNPRLEAQCFLDGLIWFKC